MGKLINDRRLIPRLKDYLFSLDDGVGFDADMASEFLITQFPEYARKKRKTFIDSIYSAYQILIESEPEYKMEFSSPLGEEEDDEEMPFDNGITPITGVNSSLINLYRRSDKINKESYSAPASPETFTKTDKVPKTASTSGPPLIKKSRPTVQLPIIYEANISKKSLQDIGGYEEEILSACEVLEHLKHPEIIKHLGIQPAKGLLLHGPPGCGKSLLVEVLSGQLQIPLLKTAATELISGVSGDSETKIRELFVRAQELAPCILFLDEIDAIAGKRQNAVREMERRIVSQLLTSFEELNKSAEKYVVVISATNRLDAIDPALRSVGRFDDEICIGIPDEKTRLKILNVCTKELKMNDDIKLQTVARLTPGYVASDLVSLVRKSVLCSIKRLKNSMFHNRDVAASTSSVSPVLTSYIAWLNNEEELSEIQLCSVQVDHEDFLSAMKSVVPSAKREGFMTVPDVSWDDVGALDAIRQELKWSILYRIQSPEDFECMGLNSRAQGVLLCGPPGCGKTLIAKAIANETGMNFISVKGPELLSMYVGESERAVRMLFQRARSSCPCVIFFDELDALVPKRSDSESGGSVRVVNQLLTEMDGLESRKQVFLIGATNRPDIIDPAILRPGRLDKILFVGFPSSADRHDILVAITKNGQKPKVGSDVCFKDLSEDARLDNFSGADVAAIVTEASVAALQESRTDIGNKFSNEPTINTDVCLVYKRHFETALTKVKASVNYMDRIVYEKLSLKYGIK